eukprot:365309-Chlamydomonas_euryale.AAC.14
MPRLPPVRKLYLKERVICAEIMKENDRLLTDEMGGLLDPQLKVSQAEANAALSDAKSQIEQVPCVLSFTCRLRMFLATMNVYPGPVDAATMLAFMKNLNCDCGDEASMLVTQIRDFISMSSPDAQLTTPGLSEGPDKLSLDGNGVPLADPFREKMEHQLQV